MEENGKSGGTVLPVEGYCVHCRTRRPMHGAIQVCNKRGGRDLKGHCGICGKSMYRLGGWDAVVAAVQKAATLDRAEYPAQGNEYKNARSTDPPDVPG